MEKKLKLQNYIHFTFCNDIPFKNRGCDRGFPVVIAKFKYKIKKNERFVERERLND